MLVNAKIIYAIDLLNSVVQVSLGNKTFFELIFNNALRVDWGITLSRSKNIAQDQHFSEQDNEWNDVFVSFDNTHSKVNKSGLNSFIGLHCFYNPFKFTQIFWVLQNDVSARSYDSITLIKNLYRWFHSSFSNFSIQSDNSWNETRNWFCN